MNNNLIPLGKNINKFLDSVKILDPFLCTSCMHCPPAIAVFQCFINNQKGANERKLTQEDVCMLQFILHQIFGTFCVRRYQQFCTPMADSLRESHTVVREWECCHVFCLEQ